MELFWEDRYDQKYKAKKAFNSFAGEVLLLTDSAILLNLQVML